MPEQQFQNPPDLKVFLLSRNITPKELATRLGVDLSLVSKWCSGSRSLFNWADLIAQAIGVNSSDLWAAYDVRAKPQFKRERNRKQSINDMYALAKTAGITQTQLAKQLRLHKTTVNHWFLGDRFLDDKWAISLAALLHVDPSEVRQAYEQRALPQFKRQSPSPPDEASHNGQKPPPQGIEVASRSL